MSGAAGVREKEWEYTARSVIADQDHVVLSDSWRETNRKSASNPDHRRGGGSEDSRSTSSKGKSMKQTPKMARAISTSLMRQDKKNTTRMSKGNLTRLANQAAKIMVSVDAVQHGSTQGMFEGCKKWIVIVYTDDLEGMNSGFKYYIKLHGKKKSSKLVELTHSETNRFKFQRQQTDVFTVIIHDIGDILKVTIGFRGLKPGILWSVGTIRVLDSEVPDRILEFPIDRDLEGDECYITMPRDDLILDEQKINKLLAPDEIDLTSSDSFCQHPDDWYQFGGCQLHVPELGTCAVTQRPGEGVPAGLMQDVTGILHWNKEYRVSFRARLIARDLKAAGPVSCILLSKQENHPKFEQQVLGETILFTNHGWQTLELDLKPGDILDEDNSRFQKALLCFVTSSVPEVILEVATPSLMETKPDAINLLSNNRFDGRTSIPDIWRGVGMCNVEKALVQGVRAVSTKDRVFRCSALAANIGELIKPNVSYRFTCDVILRSEEQEPKQPVYCCLVTSTEDDDEDEDWRDERREKKQLEDTSVTVAFAKDVGSEKFVGLEGRVEIRGKMPGLATLVFYCPDKTVDFAVANASLLDTKKKY